MRGPQNAITHGEILRSNMTKNLFLCPKTMYEIKLSSMKSQIKNSIKINCALIPYEIQNHREKNGQKIGFNPILELR